MNEYQSERIFRVSSFNPNHRQLILRSDPGTLADGALRIEIYFGNVVYMALRPLLRGIALRHANEGEQLELGTRFGILEDDREFIYVVSPLSPISFVVSGPPSWRRAERAVDDPSLFDFNQQWPPTDGMEWGEIS